MIEIIGINKTFGDRKVLSDINFKFIEGKTNLILGESGSGKTTLLKIMVGLLEAEQGQVTYDGVNFTGQVEKDRAVIRQQIGMMFQGGALFDSMTVEENVRFPLDMFTNMTKEEKRERVNFCLSRVNLENRNALFPSELSGGMKKRVAIARAISPEPKYLFCDEPNSGLDPRTSLVIDALIKEITEEYKITTCVITHDMNSVLGIGQNILFLYKGQAWWQGTNKDVLIAENEELLDFVYAGDFIKQLRPKKH